MTLELHHHIRTWTIVAAAIFIVGLLYVHESRTEASQQATATVVLQQGQQQQAVLDEQIKQVRQTSDAQISAINKQIQQVQTVAQAIAAIRSTVPPVTITPIVTQPATVTEPAKTTADDKAAGDLPVATITGADLKALADQSLTCKAQAIELNSCKQTIVLDERKADDLSQQVAALNKVKIEPAWKRTLKVIGSVLVGTAIGRAL